MQEDQTSIKDRIKAAAADPTRTISIEDAVWAGLPEKVRERLGLVRLRQLIAVETKAIQIN